MNDICSIDSDISDNSLNSMNDMDNEHFIENKYKKLLFDEIEYYYFNHFENQTLLEFLKLNMKYMKTIYYILFCVQIFEIKYRKQCKCCEKTEYKILKKQFENNDKYIPIDYEIHFLIQKFFDFMNKLSCECEFHNKKNFYKYNYLNFKDYTKIYFSIIPQLIELFDEKYNLTQSNKYYKLLPDNRCIHEDMKHNNLDFCIHKENKEIENKTNKIHYLIINFKNLNCDFLNVIEETKNKYLNQSCQFMLKYIETENVLEYFNKIFVKQFDVLNFNKKNVFENSDIIIIFLKSKIETILLKKIFDKIVKKIKNDFENFNDFIFEFLIKCIENEKYTLCIHYCDYIELNENYSKYEKIIKCISKKILESDLCYDEKIKLFKIFQFKNIHFLTIQDIINYNCSDEIISHFKKYNLSIYSNNYNDSIIDSIKKNKLKILKYIFENFNECIQNPFILYFNAINKNENNDILELICSYHFDINIKIDIENNLIKKGSNYNLLYYCLINSLNISSKILVENNIDLNFVINKKSIFIHCIEENNDYVGDLCIQKNKNLIFNSYNKIMPINYVFNYIENEYNQFLFIKNIILCDEWDVNYYDENNKNICFDILTMKNKKYKIMLFNILNNKINPKIKYNKIPLILTSLMMDEIEITYLLYQNLLKNNQIKKNMENEDIYKYELLNEDINYISIIIKYINKNDKNMNYLNLYDYKYIEINSFILNFCYVIIVIFLTTKCEKINEKNHTKNNDNETKITVDLNTFEEETQMIELNETDDDNIWIKNYPFNPNNNIEYLNDSEISETEICFSNTEI